MAKVIAKMIADTKSDSIVRQYWGELFDSGLVPLGCRISYLLRAAPHSEELASGCSKNVAETILYIIWLMTFAPYGRFFAVRIDSRRHDGVIKFSLGSNPLSPRHWNINMVGSFM
jgi:hypothetical protein